MSEIIYFVHMYFVALCALVFYKDGYHNFKTYFICAVSTTFIAWLWEYFKEKERAGQLE